MVKQKTEGQVLKMAVDRLERAKSDSQKYTVLGDMDKKLPDGKGKRFLRDVSIFTEAAEKILRDKNNLENLEKLEEAAKYLETALRKFNKDEYPEEFPEEIIAVYVKYFEQLITLVL